MEISLYDAFSLMIRLGVKSLVLEQAESLRTGGTSLTLFKNGWRVLDEMGVGDDLRPYFLEIQGYVLLFIATINTGVLRIGYV